MRPGKLGSKRSKHVEQSPAKDNNIVNVEKLDYYNTCISNSCQIKWYTIIGYNSGMRVIKAKRAIRAMTAKKSIKKYVHVQRFCFALITPIAFLWSSFCPRHRVC